MRKNILFVATLAVGILSSCSTDDIQSGSKTQQMANDGSELFVTVGQTDNVAFTRAGFANSYNTAKGTINQQFLWAEGDVFKVYCSDTWKPQTYKFNQYATASGVNGAVFTWEDSESKYNKADMENREYGVFPGNENFKFTDEYRKALHLTIPAENAYGKPSVFSAGTEFDKKGETATLADDRVYVANTLIPMFGFVKDNSLSFNFLTALLRVNIQALEAGEYKLVLKSSANKLSGEFESTEFDPADYETSDYPKFATAATEEDAEKAIAATFTADDEIGSEYFIYLPVPVGTYAANDLSLKLQKKNGEGYEDNRDITITGKYANKLSTTIDLTTEDLTVGAGDYLMAESAQATSKTASSLADLQKIFDGFGSIARKMSYDVTVTEGGIKVDDLGHTDNAYTLTVPTDQAADVVVNLIGGASEDENSKYGYFSKGEGSSSEQSFTLKLTGGNAGKKLTIKTNATSTVGLDLSDFKGDLVIIGDYGTNGSVTTPATGSFSYTGTITGDIATPEDAIAAVTLNATDVTGTTTIGTSGAVILIGTKYTGAVTVSNATSLTLLGETESATEYVGGVTASIVGEINVNNIKIGAATSLTTTEDVNIGTVTNENDAVLTAEGANVKVVEGATIDGIATTLTATQGIEVETSATIKGSKKLTVNGDITINGTVATTGNDEYTGNVTINGKIRNAYINECKTLTINEGAVIDNNVATNGGKVALSGMSINKLRVKAHILGDDAIVLTDATVKSIEATYTDGAVTTIVTNGKSDIKGVTDDNGKLAFKSHWTETTEAVDIPTTGNIYTAAQLASLQTITTAADYTLATDVTIDYNAATWTPSKAYATGTEKTFDGNSKTITGLNIVGTGNNTGLFSTISNATVKNLTLENVTVTGPEKASQKIGALAGELDKATIEGVSVTGLTLTPYADTNSFFRVGGIAGHISNGSGDTSIKDTKVSATSIKGSHYVGGLIGSISGTNKVTISQTEESTDAMVTITDFSATKEVKNYWGTFGMLIGGVDKADAVISITKAETGKFYTANKITSDDAFYYESRSYVYNDVTFKFVGMDGNYVGFSPAYNYESDLNKSTTTTNVTIGTTTYKWNELNKYKASF